MLERVSTILKMADEAKTSAIAFICIDYSTAYSVVKTAEKVGKPVIVMLLPEHVINNNCANMSGFAQMVKELAGTVKVPVGLHLDHSYDYNGAIEGIRKGFDSIMIDASSKPLKENISITKSVVDIAHGLNCDVEAEIGHVGLASESAGDDTDMYTKPDAVEEFVKKTHCDSLTIAIGNAHGDYITTPKLDIQRLEEINEITDCPLVLHGGSGIPHDQLEVAFRKGVNKFNVGTEFLNRYYDAVKEYIKSRDGHERSLELLDMPVFIQERLMAYLEDKLELSKF